MKNKIVPFAFPSAEGMEISAWKVGPAKPAAVLQIVHGMAEHKDRYLHFADFCAENGIRVYIHDLLGHGRTAPSPDKIGTLPARNGWQKIKDDIHSMSEIIRGDIQGVPHFLLGHSMGSLLVRSLLMSGYCDYSGIILSGSPVNPGLLGPAGSILAWLVMRVKGRDYAGNMLHNMVYASNNRKFRPASTDFDWLSRNLAVGEAFTADPYCGKVFSAGFYYQLAIGVKGLFSPLKNSFVPVSLPVYLISGSMDPVGSGEKGIMQAYRTYRRAGLGDLELKIYPEARHEILNEINKEEVYSDILDWMRRHY
ncbi:MAG: alpha/beta fold hydrolase [Spirochaetales bacterium]|nr:alpha/beta fold hydrolase [Spirochaetales bacterium]